MVTHPQVEVRRLLARAHHVRPDQCDRLVDDPDDYVRRALAAAFRVWPALPEVVPEREPLTRAAAETMVAADRPYIREQAAAHPDLPVDLVERLAADPDHGVRLAVSMRPELTEEQRAVIGYRIGPEDRIQPAVWARHTRDPEVQRRCATSAHIGLRRSVALNEHLAPDLVAGRSPSTTARCPPTSSNG
ncbi:hypothetical protein [Dactylosporangium sp. NPDC006015]|uniref:hypothetical protein n=1 Tax=Dactylosporangium sp. NPDC006015 TaxID=3154576 RepID=UPI0033AC2FA0